jgi:hypothetical protein
LIVNMLRILPTAFGSPSAHGSQRSSNAYVLAVLNQLCFSMKKLMQVALVVSDSDCTVLSAIWRHLYSSGYRRVHSGMVQIYAGLSAFVVEVHSAVWPGWAHFPERSRCVC